MSQENVEVVRSIYGSLNDGDWDKAFRLVAPEFEVTFQRGPNAGTHRGREAIRAVLEDQREAFAAWNIEVERVIEGGDEVVVAVIKSHLRPKGTEAEFEIRNGHIWTIREGAALSLRGFPNPEEALEAAGLSE